jgi:hypothetical protein
MMILRCALLLAAAVTLSNCCLSSIGCVAPSPVATTTAPVAATAAPVAWDGLGNSPEAGLESDADYAPAKKRARRKQDVEVSAQSKGNVSWQEQQAADSVDDARLRQKLIICKNCASSQ